MSQNQTLNIDWKKLYPNPFLRAYMKNLKAGDKFSVQRLVKNPRTGSVRHDTQNFEVVSGLNEYAQFKVKKVNGRNDFSAFIRASFQDSWPKLVVQDKANYGTTSYNVSEVIPS